MDYMNNNNLYDRLLEEGEVLGGIAYSVYKQGKISFINKFKSENNELDPVPEELSKWRNSHCTDESCKSFVAGAEVLLKDYLEKLISSKHLKLKNLEQREQKLKENEEQFKKREKDLRDKEKKARKLKDLCPERKHYLHGVSQSLVASLILVVLTAGFFILYQMNSSVKSFVDSILQK
jgi:exonuclease VII large subunit